MSFSKTKQERIKNYILQKINEGNKNIVQKTSAEFAISLTTIYRYLHELEDNNIIRKNEVTKEYELISTMHDFHYGLHDKIFQDEDLMFIKEVEPYIKDLPFNVYKIWEYSFTEMMNNVIDHSESPNVSCLIVRNFLETTITIVDFGIGIFEKIKAHYGYETLDNAISELFKGKLTTDTQYHSGEGIFFTSRALDRFAALSSGKIFTHDPHFDFCSDLEGVPILDRWKNDKGTKIIMSISNNSSRTLREVMDMFSNQDDGFIKTQIPLKNIFADGFPVSRSQAKRLCTRLDNFKEIILDFSGVEDLGQGFSHQLFVVFQNEHPDIKFVIEGANDNVTKMINHVKSSIIC